jgi:hypothetical protein
MHRSYRPGSCSHNPQPTHREVARCTQRQAGNDTLRVSLCITGKVHQPNKTVFEPKSVWTMLSTGLVKAKKAKVNWSGLSFDRESIIFFSRCNGISKTIATVSTNVRPRAPCGRARHGVQHQIHRGNHRRGAPRAAAPSGI